MHIIIIIIIHAFMMHTSSVMILNQRRQHDKGVDVRFEKVSLHTAFEGVDRIRRTISVK